MAVDIALRVRTQQMEAALSSIPGMTRKEVRRAVKAAEREWKQMPRAARKAARDAERAVSQRMQLLRTNVANVMGDVTNDIGDAVEMFGAIGPAGAAAGASLLAVAAAAAAIGGSVYGLYRLVDGAAEAREELRKLEEQGVLVVDVTQKQERAFAEYEKAAKAIPVALSAMRVELAGPFATAVSNVATGLLAATLALRDFGGEVVDTLGSIGREAEQAQGWQRFRNAILSIGQSEVVRYGRQQVRGLGDDAAESGKKVQGYARYLQEARAMMDALAGTGAGGDSIAAPAVVPGRRARVPSSARRAAAAAPSIGAFGPELTMDEDPSSIVETRTGVARMMEQIRQQELAAEQAAAAERARIAEMEQQQIRETMDMRRQAANELIGSLSSTAQAFGANADAVAGAALIQTVAMQAVAVAKAFAIDPITGALRAGVAIATIAPQIAQLARVSGGSAPSSVGGAGGGAGGPSGGMQAGPSRRRERDPSGTITVVSEYRHQLLDRAVQDSTRRIGSPLRQELRARRRR